MMTRSQIIGYLLIFGAIAIAVLGPIGSLAATWGPGWGEVMNGSTLLVLVLLGAAILIIGAFRDGRRRR